MKPWFVMQNKAALVLKFEWLCNAKILIEFLLKSKYHKKKFILKEMYKVSEVKHYSNLLKNQTRYR